MNNNFNFTINSFEEDLFNDEQNFNKKINIYLRQRTSRKSTMSICELPIEKDEFKKC